MRRTFPVAFLSALLVTLPSAFAQRAVAHGGGFSSGHVSAPASHSFGGFSSSRSSSASRSLAPRSFANAPRMTSTAPSRAFAPGYRVPYGATPASRRSDGRSAFHYRSPYRGYGGYPYYANSWEVLPWDLGYPDSPGYNGDSGSDAAQQPAASIAPPDDGYRQDYGEPVYQNSTAFSSPSIAEEPQLTLIFNDGHQEAIRNYVLTSDTVIVLDQAASGRQQRVPLAELNLPATEQAAQQAGLDFSPPA
jgi:hypothetical protein